MQILCAEDDPLEGRALVHILTLEGYAAELAADGRAACERICENPGWFKLLVTDHEMPHMTGLNLVQRARGAGFAGPIIVHASGLKPEVRQSYCDSGATAFVDKVSAVAVLLAAIAEHAPR